MERRDRLRMRWPDDDANSDEAYGVHRVLERLVPAGRAAAALVTASGERIIAVVTDRALYRVTRVPHTEDQPRRADLRVSPVRPDQGHVQVSVTHREGQHDELHVGSAWSFDLGQGETLDFTTQVTWGEPIDGAELFARTLAEALGCPLDLSKNDG